jgi:hypothetical protein
MVVLDFSSTEQDLKCGLAVRISLDKSFELAFSEVANSQILNARLQQDICTALCIPNTVVSVILMCFQQGKLMAEVVFKPDEQLDSDIFALAEELICKVKDNQSALHNTLVGRFADDAEIQGNISLSLCEIVMESQVQMLEQLRIKRSRVKLQLDALLQIMVRKIGFAFLARTFGVWFQENYRSRCIYHSGMKLLLRYRLISASAVFQTWATQTFDQRKVQDFRYFAETWNEKISSCLAARKNRADLKTSWKLWLAELSDQRRMENSAFRVIFRRQDRTLFGALSTWLTYFMKQRRLSSKAKIIRHNTRNSLCLRCLSSWAKFCGKKSRLHRRFRFLHGRNEAGIAKAVMGSWFQRIVEKACMLRAGVRVASRSHNLLKHCIFSNWARGMRLKKRIITFVARMSIESKARVVDAWEDPRKQLRNLKKAVNLLIKHIDGYDAFENCQLMLGAWKSQVLKNDLLR